MSKYIYTTIYEEFTGLKPPEPKDHKPRRRRGYGHPYRMRLNMQENSVQSGELLSSSHAPHHEPEREVFEQAQVSIFQPTVKQQAVRRFTSGNQGYRYGNTGTSCRSTIPEDHHSSSEPKVTYKKRRQYGSSNFSLGSMNRDGNGNPDY